jgi:hypothetical protein
VAAWIYDKRNILVLFWLDCRVHILVHYTIYNNPTTVYYNIMLLVNYDLYKYGIGYLFFDYVFLMSVSL